MREKAEYALANTTVADDYGRLAESLGDGTAFDGHRHLAAVAAPCVELASLHFREFTHVSG